MTAFFIIILKAIQSRYLSMAFVLNTLGETKVIDLYPLSKRTSILNLVP